MSKEKEFEKWLNNGVQVHDARLKYRLNDLRFEIQKKFKSKTQFKNQFKRFNLSEILNEEKEIKKIIDRIDEVYKYLLIPKISPTLKKGEVFYRVFPNQDINFFKEIGKSAFYTYDKQKLGRFNDENTKLLYLSTCFETAMNECGGRALNTQFSVVKYISQNDINLSGLAYQNPFGTDNFFEFSFNKYLELLSFDSRYLSSTNVEKLHRVTNYYRKKFFDESLYDGFVIKSARGTCENSECQSLNISIRKESEEFVKPVSVHVVNVAQNNEEKYRVTDSMDLILEE